MSPLSDRVNPENEVIIFEESPHMDDVVEMHRPKTHEFSFPSLPMSGIIEVSEGHQHKGPKDGSPKDRWDWGAAGLPKFMEWCQDRLNSIPDLTGNETTAIERAISYLERFNKEISSAIRNDYDGEIDTKAIESVRHWIHKSIEKLEDMFESRHEKEYKRKKTSKDNNDGKIVKEARTPYVGGIIVTVPLIISRCARVCINGTVSAGHDLSTLFNEQVKKYSLNNREQAELVQHLEDMGFPIRSDRLMLPNEKVEVDNGRGDLASNYKA